MERPGRSGGRNASAGVPKKIAGARQEVILQVKVGKHAAGVPLDIEARYVWVYHEWFEDHGGEWKADRSAEKTADGSQMEVCGEELRSFRMWGHILTERMRVASRLPSKLLLGSRFWRQYGFVPKLAMMRGK